MKDFVKVINRKGSSTVTMRRYLGEITMADNEKSKFDMSTNLNNVGLMVEDREGNIIGLDSKAFISYITNHFHEILNEPKANGLELLRTAEKNDVIEYVRPDGQHELYTLSEKVRFDEKDKELKDGINVYNPINSNSNSYNKAMYLYKRQANGNLVRLTIHEEENT